MSIGPYLGEVYRIAEELRDEVRDDDVDAIYRELKRLGYEGWSKWKSSNRAAVLSTSNPHQYSALEIETI